MSHTENTTVIDKKTPIKMPLGLLVSILGGAIMMTASVVGVGYHISQRMDDQHADCLHMFDQSWHVADEVEKEHQLKLASNSPVDISEVLRVTRHGAEQLMQHN